MMKEKTLNNQFLLLQGIAIILVVLNHKGGGGINVLSDWFTSYRMPLFIFISGYFFKLSYTENVYRYIIKKTKHLILPYFGWNLFYAIVAFLLVTFGILDSSFFLGELKINFKTFFIDPFIHGHQYIFNLATWFVLSLFIVQLIYLFFRKICQKLKFNNDFIILLMFFLLSLFSINYSNQGVEKQYYSPFLKAFFFLFFFHFGYYYKSALEKLDNLNSFIYFGILFSIQLILYSNFENSGFIIPSLNFNGDLFLPIINSLTGILLWLRVSKILVKALENSSIMLYIGKNSWDIMTHHLFVFFLINWLLSVFNIPDFNIHAFRTDIWYSYIPKTHHILLLYSSLGIFIPLLYRYYITKISEKIEIANIINTNNFAKKNKYLKNIYSYWKKI